jgi:hypothetical protein
VQQHNRVDRSKSKAKDKALGLWYRAQKINNEANIVQAQIALLSQRKVDPSSVALTDLLDRRAALEKRYELVAQGHREALDMLQQFSSEDEEQELPFTPLLGFQQQAIQVQSGRRLDGSEIKMVDLSCTDDNCQSQEALCESFVTGRSRASQQKLAAIVMNHSYDYPPWMDTQQMCSAIDQTCYIGMDAVEKYVLDSSNILDSPGWVSSYCSGIQDCQDSQCSGCDPNGNAGETCDWCCGCRNDTIGYYAASKNSYNKCGIYSDTVNKVRAKKGLDPGSVYIWYDETLLQGKGGCRHNIPWGTPVSDVNSSICLDPDNMKVFAMTRRWNDGYLNTQDQCNQPSCDVNPLITTQEDCTSLSTCSGDQCAYCETREYYNYQVAKTKVSCSLVDATGRSLSESLCIQACTDSLASDCKYIKDNVSSVEFCLVASPPNGCSGSVTIKGTKDTKATFNQLSCSDFTLGQCGWAKTYFANAMDCDITQLQCKNKADCEKAGQCDYSYMSFSAQAAGGLCARPHNVSNSDPLLGDTTFASCTGTWMSYGCVDATLDQQSCTSMGAKWFPFAYSAADCEVPGYVWAQQNNEYQGGTMMCCIDGNGEGNDFTCNSWSQDDSKDKCEACGGAWKSIFPFKLTASWVGGTWSQVHKWEDRRVDPKNQWSKTLQQSKVLDIWQDIVNSVRIVPMKNFVNCRLNPTLSSLAAVASGTPPQPVLGSIPILPGSNSVSKVGDFVVNVDPTSVTGKESVDLTMGLVTASSVASDTNAGAAAAKGTSTRGAGKSRLMQASTAAALTDLPPSCYTKVVQNGKNVGQLIGDCLTLKPSRQLSGGVNVCLPTQSTIAVSKDFTVDAFATKQADGTYSVYPTTATRSTDNLKICASVKDANTYCPIRRFADYTSAAVKSADGSCGAITAVAESVQQQAATMVNVQVPGLVQKAAEAKTVASGAAFSSAGQVTNVSNFVAQAVQTAPVSIVAPVVTTAAPGSTTKPKSLTGTTSAPGTASSTQASTTTQGSVVKPVPATTISGSFTLRVDSNAETFVNDKNAIASIGKFLASQAKVDAKYVNVVLTLAKRRLSDGSRMLATAYVVVSYSITIPNGTGDVNGVNSLLNSAKQDVTNLNNLLSAAMKSDLGNTYSVTVTSVGDPTSVTVTTTTQKQSGPPPSSSDALQHLTMSAISVFFAAMLF